MERVGHEAVGITRGRINGSSTLKSLCPLSFSAGLALEFPVYPPPQPQLGVKRHIGKVQKEGHKTHYEMLCFVPAVVRKVGVGKKIAFEPSEPWKGPKSKGRQQDKQGSASHLALRVLSIEKA